jgi:hypothetical protein
VNLAFRLARSRHKFGNRRTAILICGDGLYVQSVWSSNGSKTTLVFAPIVTGRSTVSVKILCSSVPCIRNAAVVDTRVRILSEHNAVVHAKLAFRQAAIRRVPGPYHPPNRFKMGFHSQGEGANDGNLCSNSISSNTTSPCFVE